MLRSNLVSILYSIESLVSRLNNLHISVGSKSLRHTYEFSINERTTTVEKLQLESSDNSGRDPNEYIWDMFACITTIFGLEMTNRLNIQLSVRLLLHNICSCQQMVIL